MQQSVWVSCSPFNIQKYETSVVLLFLKRDKKQALPLLRVHSVLSIVKYVYVCFLLG